jgi:hypothetical protein
MLSWLVLARNGYETVEYKVFAGLFGQMRAVAEKTIANWRESAHVATMSEQADGSVRRLAGLLP